MNTTNYKAKRTNAGDYIYRGEYVLRGEARKAFIVGRRWNNGNISYRRFQTLKAACAFIDTFTIGHE